MAFYIEHRLGVSAPPEFLWRYLSDIEGWSSWNPIYGEASGRLKIGERVTYELVLSGEEPEVINSTVIDWAPELQIHLKVKLYGGLLRTTRYMEIEKLTPTGCIFSNGEVIAGPLAMFFPRRLKRAMRAGFAAMGEALKERAEAAWRDAPRDPK
jgi:hypothetical protein